MVVIADTKIEHNLLAHNLTILGFPKDYGFIDSHFGCMTDMIIWSHSFTAVEAVAWTLCEDMRGGDLVDWRTATWRAQGL